MIMDARRATGHILLPIFYHLDPSEVRNQEGRYHVAFLHTRKASRLRWRGWKSEGQLLEKLRMAGMVLRNWFIIFLFPPDSSSPYATQVKEDVPFF